MLIVANKRMNALLNDMIDPCGLIFRMIFKFGLLQLKLLMVYVLLSYI